MVGQKLLMMHCAGMDAMVMADMVRMICRNCFHRYKAMDLYIIKPIIVWLGNNFFSFIYFHKKLGLSFYIHICLSAS